MNKSSLMEVKGSVIREITGTITQLWPRKCGSNERGEWSLQNGKLKLADGGELVSLCFSGHADMTHLRNKVVHFISNDGGKGLHGVQVGEVGFGKEQGNLEIKITATATIEQGAGAVNEPAPVQQPVRPAAPVQTTVTRLQPADSGLEDLMNLWEYIYKDPRVDAGSAEATQGAASTVFIAAVKNGFRAPDQIPM